MRKFIRNFLNFNLIWSFINFIFCNINRFFTKLKNFKEYDESIICKKIELDKKINCIFSDLTVLHGPFKGMIYPNLHSIGSAIYPKLLGSYEKELSDAINYIKCQSYSTIVDIGCAEGYYAIGFGMNNKNASIYAFDTNQNALKLCKEMGKINGVNIITNNFCDKNKLLNIKLGKKALIFCDCEGYEMDLIDNQVAKQLQKHDILIETHDFLNIEITKYLLNILNKTHKCIIYKSIDDIDKTYDYKYSELNDFNLNERYHILAENRPTIMKWIFAKAIN